MFTKLYRLFCGYVYFRASGGFCERFLNLCSNNGIILWDINVSNKDITACTKAKHYRNIKSSAVRSGMITKIESKHGLVFFIKKYRKRIGLLYGIIFGICFIGIMSTMVWSINISGNNKVTDEQIREVLSAAGVRHGALRKNVDAAGTRFYAMESLPDLSYITVNVIGSCIEVKVSEQSDEPFISDRSVPCDVVSTVDGQIVALEVYHGTKLYKEGEAVRAGEVLAGGFIELGDGSVKFKHAEAYALIRTNIDLLSTTSRQITTLKKSSESSKLTLHIMGFNIPLYIEKNDSPSLTRSRRLTLGGFEMPFGITHEICRTYEEKEQTLNDDQLLLTAAENYMNQKIDKLSNSHICSQQIGLKHSGNSITVSNSTLAEISAGAAKEMIIE
ncbi:MAG: sporulation protein YqfD [Clostridia bacterium]|nr:sporulation protein YqfD [Clostridia bacterium]